MSDPGPHFVSTGHLPDASEVAVLMSEAHRRFAPHPDGTVSEVYPSLAGADPDAFGLCVVGVDGAVWSAGDSMTRFALMSVSKPFTFALLCDRIGVEEARLAIGVDATGLAFNSLEAVARSTDGRTNPMVNPGALATVSAWSAAVSEHGGEPGVDRLWDELMAGFERFAGHDLELDDDTYRCAMAANHRNRELVGALASREALTGDPEVALDLYTRQCCLWVSAEDLACMGATLAHGGVNPRTDQRVVDPWSCRATLAVMATAGMYETSGDWLYRVGLPAKSGIGGGLLTVSPGKGALGTFSAPLDPAGNSERGRLAATFLARGLGLDLFGSSDAPVAHG